jgi:hypothetical protein
MSPSCSKPPRPPRPVGHDHRNVPKKRHHTSVAALRPAQIHQAVDDKASRGGDLRNWVSVPLLSLPFGDNEASDRPECAVLVATRPGIANGSIMCSSNRVRATRLEII